MRTCGLWLSPEHRQIYVLPALSYGDMISWRLWWSTVMQQFLCQRFGFDAEGINVRLGMIGLSEPDRVQLSQELQTFVIRPNIDAIIDSFYEVLGRNPQFTEIVRSQSQFNRLKMTQRRYLLSLGHEIDTRHYFEERLRIGAVHQYVGVSLGLYHSSYRLLQSLLIDNIPQKLESDPAHFRSLVQFIITVTALDMSLAIETYYSDKVISLERSIGSILDEGRTLRKSLQTDSLTNLCSRAFAINVLKEALPISQEKHRPLSVVMADLDHFKKINDQHGHLVGDKVLAATASRLTYDSRDGDTIGRYGGDEFIMILEDSDLVDATRFAERIRNRMNADPIALATVSIPVTISLGVAEAWDDEDAESLVARADRTLYKAKAAGRDCVRDANSSGLPMSLAAES